jgi:hypothetical protein
MQYNQGFDESGGLFRYIVNFVLTAFAGLFLYIIFFVLTGIAIYFIKKNNLEYLIPKHSRGNLIYLNSASEQWHKNRRRK